MSNPTISLVQLVHNTCLEEASKLGRGSVGFGQTYTTLRDRTVASLARQIKRALTGGVSKGMLRKIDATVAYLKMLAAKGITLEILHISVMNLANLPRQRLAAG